VVPAGEGVVPNWVYFTVCGEAGVLGKCSRKSVGACCGPGRLWAYVGLCVGYGDEFSSASTGIVSTVPQAAFHYIITPQIDQSPFRSIMNPLWGNITNYAGTIINTVKEN
jgi:hypothetical protein